MLLSNVTIQTDFPKSAQNMPGLWTWEMKVLAHPK